MSTDTARTRPVNRPANRRASRTGPAPGVNLAVLAGELSGEPEVRDLGERGTVASFALRTAAPDGATSVPVAVWSPPAWLEDAPVGAKVVLVGFVRRRFFRSAGGTTGSRVEVEAVALARDTARSRAAMIRRAEAALGELA